MMQRMHCTLTELEAQPVVEMAIFEAFILGEADGQDMLKQQAQAQQQAHRG